jgi:hypothetical protein
MVYDVPTYIENKAHEINGRLKITKLDQYPGFFIDLDNFLDVDDYLKKHFKKSSRYKLKKYKKRLETCFDISYEVFWGSVKKETYDALFGQFRVLLEKRFAEKRVYNNNLDPKEWNFYREVAYPLIHEKKAALFVVFEKECPIAVTLLYFNGDAVIDAITVFDPDYSKFHLGSCSVMQLIQWCIEKGYKKLDFSKGYFDYKTRWSTHKYQFEYHILYNPKSALSTGLANLAALFFRLKGYLRRKNVNWHVHKATYLLKNFKISNEPNRQNALMLTDSLEDSTNLDWTPVSLELAKDVVRKRGFDFLYLTGEKLKDILLFQANSGKIFMIKGKNHKKYLVIHE